MSIKMKNSRKVLVFIIIYCFLCKTTLFAQDLEDTEKIVYQPVSKNTITGEIKKESILQSWKKDSNNLQSINLNKKYTQSMETQAYIPTKRQTTIFEDMQSKIAYSLGEYVVEPLEILGEDNRTRITQTTEFPDSAICYLEMKFPDSDKIYVGTAWMYGKYMAVTAGHCVYDKSLGGWAEWIKAYPGRNGSKVPYGSYRATVLYTDEQYLKNESDDYDWGILTFAQNIGSKTGYFGASYSSADLSGTSVVLRGYPGEYYAQMWTMSGKIVGCSKLRLNYHIDTTGGQSGSPVYKDDGKYQCVGIHIQKGFGYYNQAIRITKDLFDIMNKYR